VKGGSLGFEDEKYSYVAVSRAPVALPPARIVGRPQVHSGLIELALCATDGLGDERITRKDKDAFRAARKAVWGGTWERPGGIQRAQPASGAAVVHTSASVTSKAARKSHGRSVRRREALGSTQFQAGSSWNATASIALAS